VVSTVVVVPDELLDALFELSWQVVVVQSRARGASARRIARAPLGLADKTALCYEFGFLTNGVIMAKRIKRREWTKKHVRELKTLARQKTPAARIAKSLKRTLGATRQKAFSLGVSLDSRG
jgi:hypothetical protein